MTTDPHSITAIAESAELLDDLRSMSHELLGRSWSVENTLALLGADRPVWAPDVWKRLREAGWDNVLVAEAAGGGGGGGAELCVMAEELGRVALPVPFVPIAVAQALIGQGDGSAVPTIILACPDQSLQRTATGVQVSGHDPLVPYGDLATSFVVLVDLPDGEVSIARIPADRAGVARTPVRPLDEMPSAAVTLEAVEVTEGDLVSLGAAGAKEWARAESLIKLGWAAELTGIAAGANELAADYAKERIAFGRPIGTFQAIKHRLVDQRADIEVARALIARAATAVDADASDALTMVSLASFWAIDTLRRTPEGAIQVLGGIGYTWEHPAHVFLRHAAVLTTLLGERAAHREHAVEWLLRRAGDAQ